MFQRNFPLASLALILAILPLWILAEDPPPPVGDRPMPTLGLQMTAVKDLTPTEDCKATLGQQVAEVAAGSAAQKADIRRGDIIVQISGEDFPADEKGSLEFLRAKMLEKGPGGILTFTVYRDEVRVGVRSEIQGLDQDAARRNPIEVIRGLPPGSQFQVFAAKERQVLRLRVVLGEPESGTGEVETKIRRHVVDPGRLNVPNHERLTRLLVKQAGVELDLDELLHRLHKVGARDDGFLLSEVQYLLQNPFRMEPIARRLLKELDGELEEAIKALVLRLDLEPPRSDQGPLKTGITPQEHLEQLRQRLDHAASFVDQAFKEWSAEDRELAEKQLHELSEQFLVNIYLHADQDLERYQRNKRLLELAGKVNYLALAQAQQAMLSLIDAKFLAALRRDLIKGIKPEDLEKPVCLLNEGKSGNILIAGTGRNHHLSDAAITVDLGGDDFYMRRSGASLSAAQPIGLVIDYDGNDVYQSTESFAQGCGRFGIGMLVDLKGDDRYVAAKWGQGVGALGFGLLYDAEGDDEYRGRIYLQGAGLLGGGLLWDVRGDDRYEGLLYAQGVGMPRGYGALVDIEGRDRYYAKGLQPTNYGDPGQFDAWSQGLGVGFRGDASGGIGILKDREGSDQYVAGHFSQGGGYSYGWGILQDDGKRDDRYVGSRYNQGFAAHQALGTFLEAGGDDVYDSLQYVAQGLAWDQCVVYFEDEGGNDLYRGGDFSLGASAHNSLSIFRDRVGKDQYLACLPGQATTNSYHGGRSVSVFLDEGGGEDRYAFEMANDKLIEKPEHGFALDLKGTMADVLSELALKKLKGEAPK